MNKPLPIKVIYIFISIFLYGYAISQNEINIEGSQVISNFKFVNSSGEIDKDYVSITGGAYGISYQRTTKKNLLFKVGAGMRKAGSSLTNNNDNYSWHLQYIDARVSIGYMLNKWRIKPYIMLTPYYSFLTKAYQTVNAQNYDMVKNKTIKNSDYGVNTSLGIKVPLSDLFSIYAEGSYLYGLQNNEIASKQQLYNRAYFITLGAAIKISKLSPKWVQEGK